MKGGPELDGLPFLLSGDTMTDLNRPTGGTLTGAELFRNAWARPDEAPTSDAMAVTIGGATLMLGDCIERMRDIADASVDLVLTDPPYSSGATREAGRTAYAKTMTRSTKGDAARWFGTDSLSTRGFMTLIRLCALEWQRVLKPGGHAVVFIDWRMDDHLAEAIEDADYQRRKALMGDTIETADLRRARMLVWDKVNMGMGTHFRHQYELALRFTKGVGTPPLRRDVGDVLRCKPVRFGAHPTEKPEELLGTIIETLCPVGGLVLDSFFGSCSAGVAAVNRGRRFVGVEREPQYFGVGWQRLTELQTNTAA